MRLFLLVAVLAAALAAAPGNVFARGGDYVVEGAAPAERAQIRAALDASSFDWGLVGARITIHVRPGIVSHSTRGHIWLDSHLLRAGRFAWATIQDEYAHQLDFFRFDEATRRRLTGELGARDWCYAVDGLAHSEYGCERFASTLVWTYWRSPDNAYRPTSRRDEAAAMAPARFRALLAELLTQ
jgi:hypothetical protein